jgi:hypothetical protein
MTIPDNATLAAALDKRLTWFREKEAEVTAQIANLSDERMDLFAHIAELEWMKKQLPTPAPALPPAPAEARAAKKSTLAECLAAIRAKFILPLTPGVTDRMAQEQLKNLGYKFSLPIVRYALAQIGEESRAVTTQSSPAESPPVAADGGAGDEDFPIIPRVPRPAPAAAE